MYAQLYFLKPPLAGRGRIIATSVIQSKHASRRFTASLEMMLPRKRGELKLEKEMALNLMGLECHRLILIYSLVINKGDARILRWKLFMIYNRR